MGRFHSMIPTRRSVVSLLLGGATYLVGGRAFEDGAIAQDAVEDVKDLKPGQYTWNPELSPEGPVAIIVSLPEQLCYVYRNGIQIGVSTVSTGKPGHETPTGVFTILQKAKVHHSSTYNEASMPYTERLTWQGVALHAGGLPGYPSSHGCIHLPLAFSQDLFGITQIGTPVIVAGDHTDPTSLTNPGMVLSTAAASEMDAAVAKETNPVFSNSDSATSILVSGADKSMYVLENGDIVAEGKATIADPSRPLGSNVFILQGADGGNLAWHAIGFHNSDPNGAVQPDGSVIRRIQGPPNVIEAIKQRMKPGMMLVTTDLPAAQDTRSGKDFVVMNTVEGPV